jgi:hypothetical protein
MDSGVSHGCPILAAEIRLTVKGNEALRVNLYKSYILRP